MATIHINVKVEAAPKLKDAEAFCHLLKEIFEFRPISLRDLASMMLQHTDSFDFYCGGSHIAVHGKGDTTRLVIITEEK